MKNYIKPELEITEVGLVTMIAASIDISGEGAKSEYGVDAKKVNFADDASADF